MGYTPLLRAAQEGHPRVVEWLMDYAGANIFPDTGYGENGLFLSSLNGHVGVVSILVNRGANINRADGRGSTPLFAAAPNGHVGVVEFLFSQEGIDLDAQIQGGLTAIWTAASDGRKEVVKLLLEAGADPRKARFDGTTALDIARWNGHVGCIRLLEAALAAPELVRVLHRARAMNDAYHAIDKAIAETEGMDEEERKRKILAATPAYLKGRVERGEELPQVEVVMHEGDNEKEKLAAVAERMIIGGQVPSEVFVDLMKMIIPKWDDERRRG